MKKILTLLCLLIASLAYSQSPINLSATQTIGQTSRNQKVGNGLQVEDTLIGNGVVAFPLLATSSDTTNFKPLGDSLGYLRRMSSWFGSGGGGVNIYNSDGAIDTNRTVNLNNYNLDFDGSGGSNFRIGNGSPVGNINMTAVSQITMDAPTAITLNTPNIYLSQSTTIDANTNNIVFSCDDGAGQLVNLSLNNSGFYDVLLTSTDYISISGNAGVSLGASILFPSLATGGATKLLTVDNVGNVGSTTGGGGSGIDTAYKNLTRDSIIFVKGATTWAIKDSVGSGGSSGQYVRLDNDSNVFIGETFIDKLPTDTITATLCNGCIINFDSLGSNTVEQSILEYGSQINFVGYDNTTVHGIVLQHDATLNIPTDAGPVSLNVGAYATYTTSTTTDQGNTILSGPRDVGTQVVVDASQAGDVVGCIFERSVTLPPGISRYNETWRRDVTAIDSLDQAASIAATDIDGTEAPGFYRIDITLVTTVVETGGGCLKDLNFIYTDLSNTLKTGPVGTFAADLTNLGSQPEIGSTMNVYHTAPAGAKIQYQTVDYSGSQTDGRYALIIRCTKIN